MTHLVPQYEQVRTTLKQFGNLKKFRKFLKSGGSCEIPDDIEPKEGTSGEFNQPEVLRSYHQHGRYEE